MMLVGLLNNPGIYRIHHTPLFIPPRFQLGSLNSNSREAVNLLPHINTGTLVTPAQKQQVVEPLAFFFTIG